MDYKKMIKAYADSGGDEKKMWSSVEVTAEAMDYLKEFAPDKYECIMRKLSESLYGKHYAEELAIADVENIRYLDIKGNEHRGAHWTADEIESATADKTFGKSVTKWDKYVAFNAFYADLCTVLDDAQIIDAAYVFWFADEDWKSKGKIWDYMSANK